MWSKCRKIIVMILVISLLVVCTSCGDVGEQSAQTGQTSTAEESVGVEPAVSPSPTPEITGKDTVKADGRTDFDKLMSYLGIDLNTFETQAKSMKDVPENTIIVGAMTYNYEFIYQTIIGFNKSQSQYKAEIKRYESKDSMILDVIRGEGCDVLLLDGSTLNILGNKTVLEDLAPYFEKSDVVKKEDLFANIWNNGSVAGRMMGVKPYFGVKGILVKKGTTNQGGWTLEEYIAFMESNPDIPVTKFANEDNYSYWFGNELSYVREVFVDWDERTCDFDNEEFIGLIKKFKNYAQMHGYRGEMYNPSRKVGEALQEGEYATAMISFPKGKDFRRYLDLKNNMLGEYELAGFPNLTGEPEYPCSDVTEPLYCINAASAKKDISWKLMEYMLSEEYQMEVFEDNSWERYPARRDLMEKVLQAQVEKEPEAHGYTSFYTGEKVSKAVLEFTEEDKEYILYILDHVGGFSSSGDFSGIVNDELKAFWSEGQSAEVTAHNIQNRVSLLLME